MKLSKNPEVNRLMILFAILLAVFMITALLLSLAGRHHLKQAVINNQASIIGAISDKYPEAEQEVIKQITQTDRESALRGQAVLSRYGIDAADLQLNTPLMQNCFHYNTAINLLLVFLTGSAFIAAVLLFLKKQYSQIQEIACYTGKINAGDYSLDIRDNREGSLSILKNEIYKITTMLKEQSAALKRDKILLAESLADISHQLKTPLTSLYVLNDLLSEDPKNREKYLHRMRSQLKRVEWLVTSLLKLSKLDAGTINMKRDDVYVHALVEKSLESLSIPLDIKMLQLDVEGEQSVKFCGDFNWSCEALINILKNCIEHTPEQGQLKISFDENPLYTIITIKDSGPGIAPEDLPYIFNRFYKGKNAAEDQVGIGLAMAQAIVAKQGGDITVTSENNRGSEFIIKFYQNVN